MAPFHLKGAVHERAYFFRGWRRQPASAPHRRHEHASVLAQDAAQLYPRRGALRHDCGAPARRGTAKDLRRFQAEQREAGVPEPKMSSIVSTLRFFFTHTLDRPDLAHRLVGVTHPRTLPAAAKPQRSRLPAERDDLPQAPGGAVGRLWRRPSPRRGLKPQGQRHPRIKSGDQRAHVAQGQAWQRRAISQRHALGGYARLASPATIARVSGATGSRR